MGISWRNGARPQRSLEILWTTSNVLRILGGPGRNRTRIVDLNSFTAELGSLNLRNRNLCISHLEQLTSHTGLIALANHLT